MTESSSSTCSGSSTAETNVEVKLDIEVEVEIWRRVGNGYLGTGRQQPGAVGSLSCARDAAGCRVDNPLPC